MMFGFSTSGVKCSVEFTRSCAQYESEFSNGDVGFTSSDSQWKVEFFIPKLNLIPILKLSLPAQTQIICWS